MICRLRMVALVVLGAVMMAAGAQADNPPQELVQYVRDARRQGLKDSSIKQNAVVVGWPATMVDAAIASAKKEPVNKASASPAPGKNVLPPMPAAGTEAPAAEQPAAPVTEPIASSPDMAKTRGTTDDYVIGAGDTLQISVWKEPDASVPSVVVRPDGKIAMPLLKEVVVAGLTPTQVEKNVTERLTKFINSPDVSVVVTNINSKKIYIVGAVKKEGPIAYTYRMSVMQALSEAGGLTDYAKRKKIYVLRNDNGKDYHFAFNYDEVIKGEKMEQNIQLLPGDTLIIPH